MMMRKLRGRRGVALVEFTLCGIPVLFAWISVVQMSIGMWYYATMQFAVKAAGAYIAHHGATCSSTGYSCSIQIKDAAAVLVANARGLDQSKISVTFTALKSDHTTAATPVSCTLDSCVTNTTAWPPTGYGAAGSDVEIKANYQWSSALAMVAPGPGAKAMRFGTFNLPAYTHQFILF